MIFSRIGRSLSRSSRVKNFLHGDSRLGTLLSGVPRTNVYSEGIEGALGFSKGYLTSAIARNNGFVSNLSDFKSLAANPRFLRLFSSESPKKKNSENFYPKGKKEVPKGEEKKNESKEDSKSNTDDQGSFQEAFMKQFQNYRTPLLLWGMGLFFSSFSLGPREQQQISFQEFKNKLLEPGLVDHIVVSNKSVAKIYVRSSPRDQTDSEVFQGSLPPKGSGGQYKYLINIGSVESFEEKLEEVQEALGVDPQNFVPVTYSSEMVWYQVLKRFPPLMFIKHVILPLIMDATMGILYPIMIKIPVQLFNQLFLESRLAPVLHAPVLSGSLVDERHVEQKSVEGCDFEKVN